MSYSTKTARWLIRSAMGYAILLGISLWLPIGLHRIVMGRRGDWWHWPVAYGLLLAGGTVWLAGGRHPIGILAVLMGGAWYFWMLISDLTTLWSWHWPFAWTIRERFDALEERFNLRANGALLLFLAISMLWLSRVA